MLQIYCLGRLTIEVDGKDVGLRLGLPAQMLAARLLLHQGMPHRRSELAAMLWPDSRPEQARTNLRRELHCLRRVHQDIDDSIQSSGHALTWLESVPIQFDVSKLRALIERINGCADPADLQDLVRAALTLYQGVLLPGIDGDWIAAERDSLHAAVNDCLKQAAARLHAQEASGLAATVAEQLIRNDPLDEGSYELLMRVQLDNGDRAGAKRSWQNCCRMLDLELGLEPSPALRDLYERLARDPAGDREINVVAPSGLVGRVEPWRRLLEAFESTNTGPRLITIEGEPGAGKTVLAQAIFEHACGQGMIGLEARAYAAAGATAFLPIRSWLEHSSLQAELSRLSDSEQATIASVIPRFAQFEQSHRAETQQQTIPPEVKRLSRQRLFDTLMRPLRQLNNPLILLLDDLQWCDQDTLQWIQYLLHTATDLPVTLVATVRSNDLVSGGAVARFIGEETANGYGFRIALGLLNEAETSDLIGQAIAQLPSDDKLSTDVSTESIFRLSGGNPFFIIELLRGGHSREPAGAGVLNPIDAAINQRTADLSPSAARLIEIAACIGRAFSESLLQKACPDSAESVSDALDELWQRLLIDDVSNGEFIFTHDCLRESIYSRISPSRRRRIHESLAGALTRQEEVLASGEIAYHHWLAGHPIAAADAFLDAANQAQSALAFEVCAEFSKLGLTVLDEASRADQWIDKRLKLTLCLANSYSFRNGYSDETRTTCAQIEILLRRSSNQDHNFEAIERLRHYYGNTNAPRAMELSRQLVEIADRSNDATRKISARRSLGFSLFQLGQLRACIDTLEPTRELIASANKAGLIRAEDRIGHAHISLGILAYIFWIHGDRIASDDVFDQLLALPGESQHPVGSAYVRHFKIEGHKVRMQVDAVEQHLQWFKSVNRTEKLAMTVQMEASAEAWLHGQRGDFELAIAALKRAMENAQAGNYRMYEPRSWARLAEYQLTVGDRESAASSVQSGLQAAEDSGQAVWNSPLYSLAARVKAGETANAESVLSLFDKAIEVARYQEAFVLMLHAVREKARFLHAAGRSRTARVLINETISRQDVGYSASELIELFSIKPKVNRLGY